MRTVVFIVPLLKAPDGGVGMAIRLLRLGVEDFRRLIEEALHLRHQRGRVLIGRGLGERLAHLVAEIGELGQLRILKIQARRRLLGGGHIGVGVRGGGTRGFHDGGLAAIPRIGAGDLAGDDLLIVGADSDFRLLDLRQHQLCVGGGSDAIDCHAQTPTACNNWS
jgi:hypothetical protein